MEQLFVCVAECEFETAGNIYSQLCTQQQLGTFDDVQEQYEAFRAAHTVQQLLKTKVTDERVVHELLNGLV